jgi:hypothetical protein
MKHNCIHCREEIEKTNRTSCGWQHKGTRQVICRLTDATPMDVLCQMIQNHNDEPSPLFKQEKP